MKMIKTIPVDSASSARRHPVRLVQRPRVRLQPSDEGRDGHRLEGRHRPRQDRSRWRAGAGGVRRKGNDVRRHAGRGGQCDSRRHEGDEGDGALSVGRQGALQRPRARREESRALCRVRAVGKPAGVTAAADDGDSQRAETARSSRICRSPADRTARSSIRRRWKRSARTATAR